MDYSHLSILSLQPRFSTVEIVLLTVCLSILVATWQSPSTHSRFGPPMVPSYLPWIGSAWTYIRDPFQFMRLCSDKYGSSYKFIVCGRSIVAISSPTAVANFLRDRSGTFDVIDYQYIFHLGGNPKSSRSAHIWDIVNKKAFTAARRGLSQRSLPKVSTTLNHLLFDGIHSFAVDDSKKVPVMEFTQKVLYMAVMRALYGPHFPADFYDDLITFDDGTPFILRSVPFLAPAATQARDRLVAKFSEYVSSGWREDEHGGYVEGASDAISSIVRELKSTDLSLDELSRLMTAFFWGTQSTSLRVAAWAVRYLVTNQEVYDRLRAEIRAARTMAYPDIDSLLSLEPHDLDDKCFSLVTSFVKEVLRMTTLPVSARVATKDTHIPDNDGASIVIREGEIVLANISSMHYSSDRYQNPENFQADRFTYDSESYDGDEIYLKPFGTGLRVCAGKNFAMHTLRMMVILCVEVFDIRLSPTTSGYVSEIPKFTSRLCTPIADPDKEIDIVIAKRP